MTLAVGLGKAPALFFSPSAPVPNPSLQGCSPVCSHIHCVSDGVRVRKGGVCCDAVLTHPTPSEHHQTSTPLSAGTINTQPRCGHSSAPKMQGPSNPDFLTRNLIWNPSRCSTGRWRESVPRRNPEPKLIKPNENRSYVGK